MRLPLLICLTMIAFAANSVLTRMAVGSSAIDASGFAIIRVLAGATTLSILARGKLQLLSKTRAVGAVSLAIYMIGFSLAYRSLDAGLGALILFGAVQIAMFGWSSLRGDRPSKRQMIGASIAFAGLALALWPTQDAEVAITGSLLMLLAGLGWAAYTLNGRGAADPLAETGANFVMALPLMCLLFLGPSMFANAYGVTLAIVSGALTSGLGYALWYAILPKIKTQSAAVLQLSVPIIAIVAGVVFLGETLTLKIMLAAALVLGGIALAVTTGSSQPSHK